MALLEAVEKCTAASEVEVKTLVGTDSTLVPEAAVEALVISERMVV